jgi:hypothetical protein
MKQLLELLGLALAATFMGCTTESPQQITVANTHYPYSRYSTSAEVSGYSNTPYRTWTTGQLQQRRLDLYAMVPLTRDRNEVPAYIYHGLPLPQQDEIKAIEVELNRRYKAGDKTAELKEFWPSSRRHIASGAHLESL